MRSAGVVTRGPERVPSAVMVRISGANVPQAPLASVRKIVDALAGGAASTDDLARATEIEHRHVSYALRAAETLGLVDVDARLTELGRALADTRAASGGERHLLRHAAATSELLRDIMPAVLDERAPTREEVVARLVARTTLGRGTAARRATDLLSWRRYLVEGPPPPAQLALKFARRRAKPAMGDEAAPPSTPDVPPEVQDDDDFFVVPDVEPENNFTLPDEDVPF